MNKNAIVPVPDNDAPKLLTISDGLSRTADAMEGVTRATAIAEEVCLRLVGHLPKSADGGATSGAGHDKLTLVEVANIQARQIEALAIRLERTLELIHLAIS